MKQSIQVESAPCNYFTQYTRIHSKLGNTLGTGVPRDYPVRKDYNVITGKSILKKKLVNQHIIYHL